MSQLHFLSMQHVTRRDPVVHTNERRVQAYRASVTPVLANNYQFKRYDPGPPEDEEMVAHYADRRGY